ncbi:hypothetical protein [Erythrobacter sp. QSSC1-22B]|uniref:hypothetical protein n=1 Tax=Erythrobacter sp. QSSC1-22B TaxID=1860125 RepID=UPI001F3F46FE|nr:hypothetical protein [Erythrobacter sp. QSSC1-22B]
MDQHHDRVGAFGLQPRHQRVHRIGLVAKREAGNRVGRHDNGRSFQRHADHGHLDLAGPAAEAADRVGGEQRVAALGSDVGREEGEVGTTEIRVHGARLERGVLFAAALVQALQFGAAPVELVIADGVEVQPDEIHRVDGRFIQKQAGNQRRGPDQVSGRHHQAVGIARPCGLDRRSEIGGAARGNLHLITRSAGMGDRPARRLQIAVEIVERDQRHLDRARSPRRLGCGWTPDRDRTLGATGQPTQNQQQRHSHATHQHTPKGKYDSGWCHSASILSPFRPWPGACLRCVAMGRVRRKTPTPAPGPLTSQLRMHPSRSGWLRLEYRPSVRPAEPTLRVSIRD